MYEKSERTDTAIEVLSALRGRKVAALMREITKPEDMQDSLKIAKLRKELLELGYERFLMYKGDEKTIDKILNLYSKSLKQNVSYGSKANSR